MEALTALKTKSQESLTRLVDAGQQQPPAVQLWGVVALSAITGGIVTAAAAKGVLAVAGILAVTPVAVTVGALGGGALGWNYMQNRMPAATIQPAVAPVVADVGEAAAPAVV